MLNDNMESAFHQEGTVPFKNEEVCKNAETLYN